MTKVKKETEKKVPQNEAELASVQRGINNLKETIANLEEDIKAGNTSGVSIFCVVGNKSASWTNSVITGKGEMLKITLANALEGHRDIQSLLTDAILMAL